MVLRASDLQSSDLICENVWGANDSKELGNSCAFIIMLTNTKCFR